MVKQKIEHTTTRKIVPASFNLSGASRDSTHFISDKNIASIFFIFTKMKLATETQVGVLWWQMMTTQVLLVHLELEESYHCTPI